MVATKARPRVRETTTGTGTGTLTLDGAVTGYQTFATAYGTDQFPYFISLRGGSEWEYGLGTVSGATLTRATVIFSSNSNNAVSFSGGTKDVFSSVPASCVPHYDAADPAAATDDITFGFLVGSVWINTTTDQAFICVDNTNGAAIWKPIGGSVITAKSSSFTVDGTLGTLYYIDISGGAVTATLPAAANAGDSYRFLIITPNTGASSVLFTVSANTSDKLQGTTNGTATFHAEGDFVEVTCIVGGSTPEWWITGMGPHRLHLLDDSELTIASDAVHVNRMFHTVDTQSDAAQDDLETIYPNAAGEQVFLTAENSGRRVWIDPDSGNIATPNNRWLELSPDAFTRFDFVNSAWRATAGCRFIQTMEQLTDGATVTQPVNKFTRAYVTLGGNRTIAVSGTWTGCMFILELRQDGSGGHTVTWFSGIDWAAGSAPTLTATASKADSFIFWERESGEYIGSVLAQNYDP